MEEYTCENCTHFRQHYIHFWEQRYDAIPCGHCVYPRLKYRRPDTLACVYFREKREEPKSDI